MKLKVCTKPGTNPHEGLIDTPLGICDCSLGRAGITTQKREGDGATPAGTFNLLFGYFRRDRLMRPRTALTMQEIDLMDGWCDTSNHPAYNTPVKRPFTASHEAMWRDDRLYDVCIVLDYNLTQRARGKGSAIFFHLTSKDRRPTEGCVAIDPDIMTKLLPFMTKHTVMEICA